MHAQTREQSTAYQEQIRQDNYRGEQERQLALEEQYNNYKTRVLKQTPYILEEYNRKVAATQLEKQKHMEAVEKFYELSESQLEEYVNIKYSINESVVRHALEQQDVIIDVINAVGEQVQKKTGDTIYVCKPCSVIAPEVYRTLKAAEVHCFHADHQQDILNLIGQAERKTLAEITADFNREIRTEVANIQEKERRDKLIKEHQEAKRAERVAKDKLPFV
jgi:hypothetical protein